VELSNSAQNSQTDIGQSAAIARGKRLYKKIWTLLWLIMALWVHPQSKA